MPYHFSMQLKDAATLEAINAAGGACYVTQAGVATKQAITNAASGALANPLVPSAGFIDFYSANATVDLYILCPGGEFVVRRGITSNEVSEVLVDTLNKNQVMVIPVTAADYPAAVETDTGFDEPANAIFLADAAGPSVRVVTIDATETIDVGTAEVTPNESGDANGFIAAAAIGVAGVIQDQGALMTTLVGHLSGGKSITVTLTAGSDTFLGFVYLPYRLFN